MLVIKLNHQRIIYTGYDFEKCVRNMKRNVVLEINAD